MNNKKRQGLREILTNIKNVKNQLTDILNEEENAFSNMPESFQGTINGENSENAIEAMEECVDKFEEILELIDSIV